MKKKRKIEGMSPYRLKDNPEECLFAKAWAEQNERGRTLSYLLDSSYQVGVGIATEPSDRDHLVAATVIQWLGSPVGLHFLAGLGYRKAAT